MKIISRSIQHNARIPAENAMGVPGPSGPVPGPNKSPHLAWSEFPTETESFAIICRDIDAPSRPDDANKTDRVVRYDFPRTDFYHWVLVDIPASMIGMVEGRDSDGVVPKGKPPGKTEYGLRGINSYREWFAKDPNMEGDYGGYDGPWPPFNDERVHRYQFTVYALDIESLGLPQRFSGADALRAMQGHILDHATIVGTYALNPNARE